MTWFTRWLHSMIWALGFGALTMSCQVLFGDFKVDNSAHGGQSGIVGPTANGGASASAGASANGGAGGSARPSGPIVVVPTSDLFTSDSGAQAKFYVSLAQKPTGPVSVPVVSSNVGEGTVSAESLSFTTDDWNAPQVVTVTGVHDPQVGNQAYSVNLGPASSSDGTFDGSTAQVSLTNIDNDSAGFFVTPTKGLTTTKLGGHATFTVVLNLRPAADVSIALMSSDVSIGTVAPASLTFTRDNWSAPQTVTVTGVNDHITDGNRDYEVQVGPPTSTDQSFARLASQIVSVTNLDNDQAGVTVALATGVDPSDSTRLRTSESGDSATFTVVLNVQPTQDVTIAVASDNSGEASDSPAVLTFTHLNWDAPQTVNVIGSDDTVADGNQPYQIKLGPITSDDPSYGKLTSADLPSVNAVNIDNDKAGYALTLLTGLDPNDASELLTSEQGTSASFSIVLTSKPNDSVQFGLSSTNGNEGKISATELDFTVDNWNKPQIVTVTGVDDNTKDGNVVYAVRVSSPTSGDTAYNSNLPPQDVKVVNLDDDVAGITPPKLLSGIDGGTKLATTEKGGTATFSVSLTSKPTSDVQVPVTSSNTNEGKVTPTTLTFTADNYATAQVVTVTGQNDSVVDGNQAYTVTVGPSTSSDMNYVGLSQTVKVTNTDDDTAYIVSNVYQGTTTEKGGTAVFSISLSSQPVVPVTLTFTSSNMNEGKVAPASLMFTQANWSTTQNVTVTGVDDSVVDGDQSYTIAVKGTNTTDPNYQYAATTLSLVNKDDDVVGLKVTAAANLQTTEAGGKATFSVALTSQPTGNVSVTVTSSNTKEGTVSPASLPFTAGNWSTAQTVTVTGVDDSVQDGNQTYTVTLKTASSSADPKYVQLGASTVSLVNKDDDISGVIVAPTTCATTPGTTATFTVVLKSQPLGPVSIALSSDKPIEGTVSPATLPFTTMNWNTAQTVTVTGLDDGTVSSTSTMVSYTIVTAAAVSAMDSNYNGFDAADVGCVNTIPAAPPPPPPPPPPTP